MREIDHHPHVPEERGELFECHDGGSTELEYLDLVWAFCRVQKPEKILETGALRGFGTVALARAVEANKLGHVFSVEIDGKSIEETQNRLALSQPAGLEKHVTMVQANTLDWLNQIDPWEYQFDFCFFDSELTLRCREFQICLDRGLVRSGSLVAFHDTSRLRTMGNQPDPSTGVFWGEYQQLLDSGKIRQYIEFPLSRGLVAARVP